MKAKYLVTHSFGLQETGTILDCVVLTEDGHKALVYHPASQGECPSFEICLKKREYYVSQDEDAYINVIEPKKLKENIAAIVQW